MSEFDGMRDVARAPIDYLRAEETYTNLSTWFENLVYLLVGFFGYQQGARLPELLMYYGFVFIGFFLLWIVIRKPLSTRPEAQERLPDVLVRILETDNREVAAAEYSCTNCRPETPNQVVRVRDSDYRAPRKIEISCAVCEAVTIHELSEELTRK